MKEFEFGTHISMPCNLDFENGIASAIQKVVVQMQEKIDEAIIREIVKAAKEQGITDLYILDKQNIMAAMRKQMPMKVLETTLHGNVEAYHCKNCFNRVATFINGNLVSGKIQKHCDECGQRLDMSEVFKL